MAATYDAIADWYEKCFLGPRSEDGFPISDPIGVDSALSDLLGQGVGGCLESAVGPEHMQHGFAAWATCPLA
jgi:hypothetical protein